MLGSDEFGGGQPGRSADPAGQAPDADPDADAVWSVDSYSQGSPPSSPGSSTSGGTGFAAVGSVGGFGSVRRMQPRSSIRMMPVVGEEGEAPDVDTGRGGGATRSRLVNAAPQGLWPPRSHSFVNERHQGHAKGRGRITGAHSFSMGGRGQLGLSPIRGAVHNNGPVPVDSARFHDGVDAVVDGTGRDSRSTVGSTRSRRSRHSLKPDSPVPWRQHDSASEGGRLGEARELQPESYTKLAALQHRTSIHRRMASNDSADSWLDAPTPGGSERTQLRPLQAPRDNSVARRPSGEGSPVRAAINLPTVGCT